MMPIGPPSIDSLCSASICEAACAHSLAMGVRAPDWLPLDPCVVEKGPVQPRKGVL